MDIDENKLLVILTGQLGKLNALKIMGCIESAKKPDASDRRFIDHIKGHLSEGQEVVCKICGKTAKEICNE